MFKKFWVMLDPKGIAKWESKLVESEGVFQLFSGTEIVHSFILLHET